MQDKDMRTFGGRKMEGGDGVRFSTDMSEIIYWKKFREDVWWSLYMGDFKNYLNARRENRW